jgi:predicted RNA binding protein YcfA (HicA-like mRNA interferase family)
MSSHFAQYSPLEAITAFNKAGFNVVHSRGKSHIIMNRAGDPVHLSIPNHRLLKCGTLRSLIRSAGLTVPEFVRLAGK